MTLSTPQALAIAAAVVLGTAVTRFLPFLLFPDNKPVPKVIEYLGRALPAAMMGLLVVYCLRNMDFAGSAHALPEIIASAIVVGLHVWRRNTLLSIIAGTVAYMLLVQIVFA